MLRGRAIPGAAPSLRRSLPYCPSRREASEARQFTPWPSFQPRPSMESAIRPLQQNVDPSHHAPPFVRAIQISSAEEFISFLSSLDGRVSTVMTKVGVRPIPEFPLPSRIHQDDSLP